MVRAVTGHIRVAIVDTEANARDLRRLLDAATDIEIVGEGLTPGDARALADAAAPDLMFLGIRLPDLNGLAAIEAVPAARRPAIVFMADREDYAYRAFELEAIDYLLCPLDPARVERALWRAHRELLSEGRRARSALGTVGALGSPQRLIVKSPGQVTFIDLDEIDWIESAGNYVRVHAREAVHVTRATMGTIEARLDARFLRVHRTAIVNTTRIRRICTDQSEGVRIILKDGTEVKAGRYVETRVTGWMNRVC